MAKNVECYRKLTKLIINSLSNTIKKRSKQRAENYGIIETTTTTINNKTTTETTKTYRKLSLRQALWQLPYTKAAREAGEGGEGVMGREGNSTTYSEWNRHWQVLMNYTTTATTTRAAARVFRNNWARLEISAGVYTTCNCVCICVCMCLCVFVPAVTVSLFRSVILTVVWYMLKYAKRFRVRSLFSSSASSSSLWGFSTHLGNQTRIEVVFAYLAPMKWKK